MTTVVDASVIVDVVARLPDADRLQGLLRGRGLVAPAHLDAEVVHALRRLRLAGTITTSQRDRAIVALARLPVIRIPLPRLLTSVVSHLGTLTAYDAFHVACVQATSAQLLLTRDRRLAAAPGLPVPVMVV